MKTLGKGKLLKEHFLDNRSREFTYKLCFQQACLETQSVMMGEVMMGEVMSVDVWMTYEGKIRITTSVTSYKTPVTPLLSVTDRSSCELACCQKGLQSLANVSQ